MSSDSSPFPDRPLSAGVPPRARCQYFTDREGLDIRIITHVVHIWSDCLRLTGVCASFFTSVDGLLFKLASNQSNGSPTSKIALSSLAGALIFHTAAAVLAYLGSLVLIRYKLHDTQAVTGSPGSTAMTRAIFVNSQSTNSSSPQTPSADRPQHVRFSEKVERSPTSSTHPRHFPVVTPSFSTGARSPLFSTLSATATEIHTSLLYHLSESSLDINMRRESLFNYRWNVPCVVTLSGDGGDGPKVDAEKHAIALMLLLNKCHNVCTRFVLTGFMLAVIGVIACVWGLLGQAVAVFGSVCVGVCLVFGFGALH